MGIKNMPEQAGKPNNIENRTRPNIFPILDSKSDLFFVPSAIFVMKMPV